MQDNDFDRLMREALENHAEPAYNPADWDMLEDRLHHFNASQTQPSAGSSAGTVSGGLAKLGFVASTVLFTALNAVNYIQPAIFGNATENVIKTAPENTLAEADQPTNITASENEVQPAAPVAQTTQPEITEGVLSNLNNFTKAENQVGGNAKVTGSKAIASRQNKPNNTANAFGINQNAISGTVFSTNGSQNAGNTAGKPANGNNAATTCAGNTKPELTSILKGTDTLRTNSLSMLTCETLKLKINTRDKETDKIRISSNVASVLPGARLIVAENGTAQILWEAKPEMARNQPYNFTLWLSDDRCPNVEPRAYAYALSVAPAFTATLNGGGKIERGQTTGLEVYGAPAGATFRWNGANGTVLNEKSAYLKVSPTETTVYRVQIIAANGCRYTDSAKVEVIQPQAIIPNIVTPNNDGKNDFFEVIMPSGEPIHLEIFDTRGKQVYVNGNYTNNWNAEGLATGTYTYVLIQNDKTYRGWVEVIR